MLVTLGLWFFGLVVVKGDSVVLGWPNLAKICHFFFCIGWKISQKNKKLLVFISG
jgi:hypothetical protein